MRLQLITLRGSKLDEDIYELIIPTAAGEIAIFPGHEALVSTVIPGVASVRLEKDDIDLKMELFAVTGGVLEVAGDTIKVLVDEADHGDDIIEVETNAALERAMKLRDEATDQVTLEKANQLITQQQMRLKVADLHRRRHHHRPL